MQNRGNKKKLDNQMMALYKITKAMVAKEMPITSDEKKVVVSENKSDAQFDAEINEAREAADTTTAIALMVQQQQVRIRKISDILDQDVRTLEVLKESKRVSKRVISQIDELELNISTLKLKKLYAEKQIVRINDPTIAFNANMLLEQQELADKIMLNARLQRARSSLAPLPIKKNLLMAPGSTDLITQAKKIPDLLKGAESFFRNRKFQEAQAWILNGMIFWIGCEHQKNQQKLGQLTISPLVAEWELDVLNAWLFNFFEKSLPLMQNIEMDNLILIIDMIMLYIDVVHESIKTPNSSSYKDAQGAYLSLSVQINHAVTVARYLVENLMNKQHANYSIYNAKLTKTMDEAGLRYAVYDGDYEKVFDILHTNPEYATSVKGRHGLSLLMLAAEMGSDQILKLLIAHGADVYKLDETAEKNSLLFYAMKSPHIFINLVNSYPDLLELKNKQGQGILELAEKSKDLFVKLSYVCIKEKIINKIKPSLPILADTEKKKCNPVNIQTQPSQIILDQSKDLYDQAAQRLSAKQYSEAVALAKQALGQLPPVLKKVEEECTILELAYKAQMAAGEYKDAILSARELCKKALIINKQTTSGKVQLKTAEFVNAIASGNLKKVESMLHEAKTIPKLKKILLNALGKDNQSVIMLAYSEQTKTLPKQAELQRLLLNQSDFIDFNFQDDLGQTLLHQLAIKNEIVAMLMLTDYRSKRKFRVDLIDRVGRTPLHWACYYKNTACVKRLLILKAATNIKDNDQKKPLQLTDLSLITALFGPSQSAHSASEEKQIKTDINLLKPEHKIEDETISFKTMKATVKAITRKLRLKPYEYDNLTQDINTAYELLEKKIENSPREIDYYLLLIELCYEIYDMDNYSQFVKKAHALAPENPAVKIVYADDKRIMGELAAAELKYKEALDLLKTNTVIRKDIKKLKILALRGLYKVIPREEYARKLAVCDEILNLNAYHWFARRKKKLNVQLMLPTTPSVTIEISLVVQPAAEVKLEPVADHQALRAEAWASFKEKDYTNAKRLFTSIISMNEAEDHFGLARSEEMLGNTEVALNKYADVLEASNDNHYLAHYNRAILISTCSPQAIVENDARFNKIIAQFKDRVSIRLAFVGYLAKTDRQLKALVTNIDIINLFPHRVDAHINLVKNYLLTGSLKNAIDHCEHFLKIKNNWNIIPINKNALTQTCDLSLEYLLHLPYINALILSANNENKPNIYSEMADNAARCYSQQFSSLPHAMQRLDALFKQYQLQLPLTVMSEEPVPLQPEVKIELTSLGDTPEDLLNYLFYHAKNNFVLSMDEIKTIVSRKKSVFDIDPYDLSELYRTYFLSGSAVSFYKLMSNPLLELDYELFPYLNNANIETLQKNARFVENQLELIDQRVRANPDRHISRREIYAIFMARELTSVYQTDDFDRVLAALIRTYGAPFDTVDYRVDAELRRMIDMSICARMQFETFLQPQPTPTFISGLLGSNTSALFSPRAQQTQRMLMPSEIKNMF